MIKMMLFEYRFEETSFLSFYSVATFCFSHFLLLNNSSFGMSAGILSLHSNLEWSPVELALLFFGAYKVTEETELRKHSVGL